MDGMKIPPMVFLTAIDTAIEHRSCNSLKGEKDMDCHHALDKILHLHDSACFKVKTICHDGAFVSMMDEVKDKLQIDVNCCNPDKHVPEAERNNRVIKE